MPKIRKPKRTRNPTFIKEWRHYRHLTQDQAAQRIGISRENYGRIENGKVPYNQDFLEIAAFAFNCTAADLIARNPVVEALVDQLRRVASKGSEKDQQHILAIAKTLIENNG